jgi:phage shock protein A
MGIFDRMGKVISSNMNALLDKAEDDGKLVELNFEEMAEQLKRGRQEVVSALAGEKQLKKKVEELHADLERWDKRAELALKSGDEPLAREALKQKKRVRGEHEIAEKARIDQRDTVLRMKSELERMEQKLEELKLRKGTIVTRAQQARAASSELGVKGGEGGAFAKFRQMEERVEGREAEGLAMAEVEEALGTSDKRALEDKFRDLERGTSGGATGGSEVDDELAALKKRIRI